MEGVSTWMEPIRSIPPPSAPILVKWSRTNVPANAWQLNACVNWPAYVGVTSSSSTRITPTGRVIVTDITRTIFWSDPFPSTESVRLLVPFFVTRQIYAGAGKVGAENHGHPAAYQLSQRADFFECLVDLNTMVKRPIINTRDEPHADPAKYRRFHVIIGDANMAELSTYLKLGTTSIVLDLLEAGIEVPGVDLDDPVRAIKEVSRDLDVKKTLKLTDGRVTTAIAVQRMYLKTALDFYACHELNQVTKDILVRWEEVLEKLEQDPRVACSRPRLGRQASDDLFLHGP